LNVLSDIGSGRYGRGGSPEEGRVYMEILSPGLRSEPGPNKRRNREKCGAKKLANFRTSKASELTEVAAVVALVEKTLNRWKFNFEVPVVNSKLRSPKNSKNFLKITGKSNGDTPIMKAVVKNYPSP
jgi:hypothetical protein